MNLTEIQQYKVIEHDKAIAIVGPADSMTGAHNLIIGDIVTCTRFLVRYVEQRLRGKEPVEARDMALRGAGTTIIART